MPPEQQQQHKNGLILAFIGVIIVAALIIWGLKSSREPVPLNPDGTPTAVVEWPSREEKREFINESTRRHEISAEYPATARADITDKLRGFVEDRVRTFKDDTAAFPDDAPPVTLDITYRETQTTRADNYVFHIYTDTGGAHGIEVRQTFSFDREGNLIELGDLFTSDDRGLQLVSEYVKKELLKLEFADSAWISDGAGPEEENYRNFIVTDEGVTFLFNPYQVAAYAAGSQEVSVPLAAFKTYANPEVFE